MLEFIHKKGICVRGSGFMARVKMSFTLGSPEW